MEMKGDIWLLWKECRIFLLILKDIYIYGSDAKVVRGQHANRKSQFVLINVSGKSKVKVKDGKGNEAIFH